VTAGGCWCSGGTWTGLIRPSSGGFWRRGSSRAGLPAAQRAGGPFDEAWINGDCAVPAVQSLDGLFKRLLEEEEE